MLGIGLMLFCIRALRPREIWSDRVLSAAFWSLNMGLLAMVLLSIMPIGLIQTWASVEQGYAFARSPELLQQPLLQFFRWMRVPGDVLFAVGSGVPRRVRSPGGAHRQFAERSASRERPRSGGMR